MNAFQLIRTRVPRQLWTRLALSGTGLRPGPGPVPQTTRQISGRERARVQVCTVDPNLEEEFVFVDYTDRVEEPRPEGRDLVLDRDPVLSCPPTSAPPPQSDLKSLARQMRVLSPGALQDQVDPQSRIQFQDVDFPLDENLVSSRTKRKKKRTGKGEHKVFGTPDVDEPVSDTCCSGCGAVLHCADVLVPGYLPSEKYKTLQQEGVLGGATCQRCHLLTHHQKAMHLEVSREQYRAAVRQIRPLRAMVLLVVDLLDLPDSVVPDLPELVGSNKHVVVLGNKVDLLPADSPGYLARIKRQLVQYCQEAGFGSQVTDVHLISAKTGFGVEALISGLQRSWKYKGDVYLVGGANAGKSTLFNTLLQSDYSKSKAARALRQATVSPWPGTTLNLLKFPIINPTPERMFRRQRRLKEEEAALQGELTDGEQRRLRLLAKRGYLVGRVGRTFVADVGSDEIHFDPDSLAFGENEDGERSTGSVSAPVEFSHNELKDAHWLYDTPGIMKDNDILSLLNEQEVMSVVPTSAIVPRTFILKPGMTLFVGGVARIDFLHGQRSCWFSVMASDRVPVHVTFLEKADGVYAKHAGHALLGVPVGGSERMQQFPKLVPQEFKLKGRGHLEATADIKLSSLGWVAVTPVEGDDITLAVHGPAAAPFVLRTPSLLPHIVTLKGKRVGQSAAYRTVKPPRLQDPTLTTRGAHRK